VKEKMKRFTAGLSPHKNNSVFWLKLVLLALFGLSAELAVAQTNFASAGVIYGDYGSVSVDNTGVVPDTNAPTIAGLAPNNTIWFQWSSTNSGEVVFDTMGSVDDFVGVYNLDTVIGAYTGSSLTSLALLAARH